MAQSSAEKHEAVSHRASIAVTSTKGPAAAFGSVDYDDDDKYSVSEISTAAAAKSSKEQKGSNGTTETFYKTTLSKGSTGLERMVSNSGENSANMDTTSSGEIEFGEGDISPDHSPNQSDDIGPFGPDPEDSEASLPSSFAIFAKTKFQTKTTPYYCCAALQNPLLPKDDKADILASLASWVTILRVMGDLPEPDHGQILSVPGEDPPVVTTVKNWYRRKYTKKDIEDAQKKYSDLFKEPTVMEEHDIPFMTKGRDSMLDKVQYICALGIYRPDLRDELYCQLCKQLTNNPSRNSTVRGWVLMMLFASSFTPSEKFSPCFQSFLRDGPPELAQKVDKMQRRTSSIGTRGFPPSWLEFQAAKNAKPILLPVTFMNGQRLLLEADAATTVRELCHHIAQTLDFKDRTGFSIYICLHKKISCLGHSQHRIMDAISECEQHTKQNGMRESSALWRLYYRKEYFTPWHDAKEDTAGTDIIYQQIMRGLSLGEYKCQNEDVYVLLAAQKYYLEYSVEIDDKKVDSLVRNWFPEDWKEEKGVPHFVEKVQAAIKSNFGDKKPTNAALKADIVTFAKEKWSLLFSRFYDASKMTGPGVGWTNIVVGLGSKGLYVMDDSDALRMHLPYIEIGQLTKMKYSVVVTTLRGEEYVVTSQHSDDFCSLLLSFLQGLRMRSKYAIITQDSAQLVGVADISVGKGDVFVFDKSFQEFQKADIYHGTCKRTGKTCDIPRDLVYVLNTTGEPAADVLGMITVQLKKAVNIFMHEEDDLPHTLQHYSRFFFRHTTESAMSKFLSKTSFKKDKGESLWRFSKDPLKKPLLKRSCMRANIRNVACRCFTAIQQYMGDAPIKDLLTDVELANGWIIEPAARNRYLRDEIFCQMVKQLTNNPNKASEDKGWQLMLMLVSSAVPNNELYDELLRFMKGSKQKLAPTCSERLERSKMFGCRLYPPHADEHDLISRQIPNMRVKVHIPDNTVLTLEVNTLTRIIDMKREVCTRLKLKTWEEYSLIMTLRESVHSLPSNDFYFDCVSHAQLFWMPPPTGRRSSQTGGTVFTLVMLKKIWVNTEPGLDQVADTAFHFPQELPNFLRGYHMCSEEVAAKLGSLVYRTKFGNDKGLFAKFSDIASKLIPKKMLATQSIETWSKSVQKYYDEYNGTTPENAKIIFLKTVCQFPTYGSVFFEVKQRSSKKMPKLVLAAVNMAGLHLIDPTTKKILVSYDYPKIPNWAYDDVSLTLIVVDGGQSNKILLETSVGHNMDDIIMSYIAWVMNAQMRRKQGFAGSPVGESHC